MKKIVLTGFLAAILPLCGCQLLSDLGALNEQVRVTGMKDLDTNGDGVVDTREIEERIEYTVSPLIEEGGKKLARSVSPGPWGEIAAGGVALLSSIVGAVAYRNRKRRIKLEAEEA